LEDAKNPRNSDPKVWGPFSIVGEGSSR